LFDTLINADGWRQCKAKGRRASSFFCASKLEMLDSFEMLSALIGYSTSRTYRKDSSVRYSSKHGVVCARLWRDSRIQPWTKTVKWSGTIWCPSTVNGTFFARRGGKTYFTGNTGRNKLDPVSGVKSMEAIFRDGLVDIPYKTDRDRKLAKEFVDQFVYFSFDRSGRRKSLTDYVMAFWFAELAIRKTKDNAKAYKHPSSPYSIANPYFRKSSSPYTAKLAGR
jgi:hypothetical protein